MIDGEQWSTMAATNWFVAPLFERGFERFGWHPAGNSLWSPATPEVGNQLEQQKPGIINDYDLDFIGWFYRLLPGCCWLTYDSGCRFGWSYRLLPGHRDPIVNEDDIILPCTMSLIRWLRNEQVLSLGWPPSTYHTEFLSRWVGQPDLTGNSLLGRIWIYSPNQHTTKHKYEPLS